MLGIRDSPEVRIFQEATFSVRSLHCELLPHFERFVSAALINGIRRVVKFSGQ
jgi:hypothetical protein